MALREAIGDACILDFRKIFSLRKVQSRKFFRYVFPGEKMMILVATWQLVKIDINKGRKERKRLVTQVSMDSENSSGLTRDPTP